MKVFLMYPENDTAPAPAVPGNSAELTRDLGLDRVLDSMGGGDAFIRHVSRLALLNPLRRTADVVYRQEILADVLAAPEVVRELYDLAVETLEAEKSIWHGVFTKTPSSILHNAVNSLNLLLVRLRGLRRIVDTHGEAFASPGMSRFAAMVREELGEDYFQLIRDHLDALSFPHGPLLSARLGPGNQGIDYILRKPLPPRHTVFGRLDAAGSLSFQLDLHDDRGLDVIAQMEARGINLVANALAQSDEHILAFFTQLRLELAFYLGAVNLHRALSAAPVPLCFPAVSFPSGGLWLTANGLRDASLVLAEGRSPVVGNNVHGPDAAFIVVTGANEGGKSTFLRSLGVAQLMMHAGLFVCAESYSAVLCTDLYTHFKRDEDASFSRGKLEEELDRMRGIAHQVSAGSVVLFNESFSSTNEREGALIALDIARAFTEAGVHLVFVTHSHEFASALQAWREPTGLFLRAERLPDGGRTFRMTAGLPQPTSHSADLYAEVFGPAAGSGPPAKTKA